MIRSHGVMLLHFSWTNKVAYFRSLLFGVGQAFLWKLILFWCFYCIKVPVNGVRIKVYHLFFNLCSQFNLSYFATRSLPQHHTFLIMSIDYRFTILVPVFNEAECLYTFSEEMNKYLLATKVATKVLFVNDGSTDNSGPMIEELCSHNKHYHYIELKKNAGLSTAIKAGIDHCDTEWIGYIDADLQTTPLDFITFFEYLPQYDIVCGIRAKRQDSFVKKISSRLANKFRDAMINDGIADTGCPLKIIKTEYARRIPFFDGMHRFIPALVQLQGGVVKQVPVQHFKRYAGTAKYHFWNRLKKPFFDTLAFRWMRSRTIRYTIKKSG